MIKVLGIESFGLRKGNPGILIEFIDNAISL